VAAASRSPAEARGRAPALATARDATRTAVYAAEQHVHRVMDRAAAGTAGVVEIAGSRLVLPPERRFGSVAAVQGFVDAAMSLRWVPESWPRARVPVTVRARRGMTAAHYERWTTTIAVPVSGDRWALRELVALHELAHHLAPDAVDRSDPPAAHGAEFIGRMLELVDGITGPEVAFLLRVTFTEAGLLGRSSGRR
jgi:putative metallohydrolase (TIGR04338 family)